MSKRYSAKFVKYASFTQPTPAMIAADLRDSLCRQYCLSEVEVWTVTPDKSSCFFNAAPDASVVDLHVAPRDTDRCAEILGFVMGYVAHWAHSMVHASRVA
jgi:hypothetical protein